MSQRSFRCQIAIHYSVLLLVLLRLLVFGSSQSRQWAPQAATKKNPKISRRYKSQHFTSLLRTTGRTTTRPHRHGQNPSSLGGRPTARPPSPPPLFPSLPCASPFFPSSLLNYPFTLPIKGAKKNSFLIRDFCREAFRISHQH